MQMLTMEQSAGVLLQEPKLSESLISTPEKISSKKKRRKWLPEEEEILQRIFGDPLNKMKIIEIANLLQRTPKAIERKKEKMCLGSSRQMGRKPKPHLYYPKPLPGSSLNLVSTFQIVPGEVCQPFLSFLKGETKTPKDPTPENHLKPWSEWDIKCLNHYWGLRALGIVDIAIFLRRTPEEIKEKARGQGLPEKPMETPTNKYKICTKWQIDGQIVREELSNDEQHALAELTATRLSHLRTNPWETSKGEKEAYREINSLFEVQRQIFHRAIHSKARKLSRLFHDSAAKEAELIQVGESALYQVISQWDPSKGINFCRATVTQNIERQMQQWIRKCRVVQLPTGLISEIVEERRKLNGEQEEEGMEEIKEKTPQRKAAIKRYLFSVHPDRAIVPLNEAYEEGDNVKFDQMIAGQENNHSKSSIIEPEHQSYVEPQIEREDMREVIASLCKNLPEDEKYAFCQYNGIGEDGEAIPDKNLRELAAECGVSAERIRQRINLAREKMIKRLGVLGIRCSADAL